MSDNLPPELKKLFSFYVEQRKSPPKDFAHAKGLIPSPGFFSIARLQHHLNNPLLRPEWVQLRLKDEFFSLDSEMLFKLVQTRQISFMDKSKIDDVLREGGSIILEGIDILEPVINSFLAKVDAAMPCALSTCVAFFSQSGTEAYGGHRDADDVLVIHLSGEKRWRIFAPQQRRYEGNFPLTIAQMGEEIAEVIMQPGDAMYLRAGVPHLVDTTADHSLHLAFDLIDQTPGVVEISGVANSIYNRGGENPHVPASKVLEHYIGILQNPDFQKQLEVQTQAKRTASSHFRTQIGQTAGVRALSKFVTKQQQ